MDADANTTLIKTQLNTRYLVQTKSKYLDVVLFKNECDRQQHINYVQRTPIAALLPFAAFLLLPNTDV